MADNMKPSIRLFMLGQDGTRLPFNGTGVRIVVTPDSWIELDFEFDRHVPVAIKVGGRRRGGSGAGAPKLSLDLHAGNSVSVVARSREGETASSWEVFMINRADFTGNILDYLKATSSGDPFGELTLDKDDRVRLSSDTFIVDYGNIATIKVRLSRSADELLRAHVTAEKHQRTESGARFRSISMLIHPHAANLVSFWFHEVEAFAPSGQA